MCENNIKQILLSRELTSLDLLNYYSRFRLTGLTRLIHNDIKRKKNTLLGRLKRKVLVLVRAILQVVYNQRGEN